MREWKAKLAPVLSETLRNHRRGRVGRSWYCDETYLKVKGCWTYFYRAIDRDGNLVDVYLRETRDRAAAEAFFRFARTVTEVVPDRVTTDGHGSYPGAITAELGDTVTHRTNRYLNNPLEQDHRGITQRTRSMCGFTSFLSAERVCRVYDEVRDCFRTRSQRKELLSLGWQRVLHLSRMRMLMATVTVA